MTLNDDFNAAEDLLDEAFEPEEITIVDPAGNEWTWQAQVLDERAEQRSTDLGTEVVIMREVSIRIAAEGRQEDGRPDLLNLRGSVVIGQLGGQLRYAIDDVLTSRAGKAVLQCRRIGSAEKSRDTYRKRTP